MLPNLCTGIPCWPKVNLDLDKERDLHDTAWDEFLFDFSVEKRIVKAKPQNTRKASSMSWKELTVMQYNWKRILLLLDNVTGAQAPMVARAKRALTKLHTYWRAATRCLKQLRYVGNQTPAKEYAPLIQGYSTVLTQEVNVSMGARSSGISFCKNPMHCLVDHMPDWMDFLWGYGVTIAQVSCEVVESIGQPLAMPFG